MGTSILISKIEYRFNDETVVNSEQLFDNVQRAVNLHQKILGADRIPNIVKKGLLWRKYENHSISSLQKTKSTQTSRSVFAEKIEQVRLLKLWKPFEEKCYLSSRRLSYWY